MPGEPCGIYADKNYLSAFSIMLDGHVIQFNAPAAVVEANGAVKINAATAWYGGVTMMASIIRHNLERRAISAARSSPISRL